MSKIIAENKTDRINETQKQMTERISIKVSLFLLINKKGK